MRKLNTVIQWSILLVAIGYVLLFMAYQTHGLLDPLLTEWDARAFILPSLRYHGSGLFADDLSVDFISVFGTPVYRLIFWCGTLVTSPQILSRLIPFVLLAIVAWQAFQLGRHVGGLALGAILMVVLVHQLSIWDRIVGATPRAYAFPLMVALVRYCVEEKERKALATMLLGALSYPSAFIVCAAAYAPLLLRGPERKQRILRFAVVSGISLVILVATMVLVNPKVGRPTTMDEMIGLKQRSLLNMYPLMSPKTALTIAFKAVFAHWGQPLVPSLAQMNRDNAVLACWALVAVLVLLAIRRIRRFPLIILTMLAGSLAAFGLAYPLAYRLYLPERLLTFSIPVAVLLGWLLLAYLALEGIFKKWAGVATALLGFAVHFVLWGDGLVKNYGIHDWRPYVTPAVRFAGTLPKDVRFAAHPATSSYVQTYGQRQVLFSGITNVQAYYPYAAEMEHRIEDWYQAYYSSDMTAVTSFCQKYAITHLLVDTNDFGPFAAQRAMYAEPWTTVAQSLLQANGGRGFALANVPAEAVLFRSNTQLIVDVKKL